MSMFDSKFDKQRALRALEVQGVVKCMIDYSGGNDEGGVDSITVTYADGREETNPTWCKRTYEAMMHNPKTGKWESKTLSPGRRQANKMADLIEQPVYDKYYTFAGEYYVHGTLEYDVRDGKVRMDGSEYVPHLSKFGFGI